LYDKIEDKKEANEIVNSLKICDPAVGSGHFLVSALNEIISIKHDLKILQDRDGKRLKEYQVEVVNDELIVTDEDGDLFEYNPTSKESQRVQVTLFHEKQTIIENCLFGVDINPNSVKICRLRLWIELLKSAYYKNETELETLPNIDINIKCGNSLISRFGLDSDLSTALKKSKWNIDSYKLAVDTYRNATSKDQKREMERLIYDIKNDFRTEIGQNSKEQKDLIKFSEELYQKYVAPKLFEDNLTPAQKKKQDKERKDLEEKVAKLKNIIEEVKSNKIYENAFEWRFEFPDVLNNEGEFVGFDTIVGNPPYFSISSEPSLNLIESKYQTFSSSGDIYSLFIELSSNIIRPFGLSTLIISNKWMRANYGESLRKFIIDKTNPIEIIDFGQNLIFENAVVHTNILTFEKNNNLKILKGIRFQNDFFNKNNIEFKDYIRQNTIKNIEVNSSIWNINDNSFQKIKNKSELNGKKLINWNIEINFGIKTGYNEAFIINEEIKNKLIKEDENVHSIIKPILRGRDTRRYFANFANLYLINSHNGYESNKRIDIVNDYPVIYKYLQNFLPKVEKRSDQGKHWTNLRNCAYIEKFSSPKIIFSEIVSQPQFYFDELGYYPEATVFFISGEKLKFLTALLNSKAVTFLYKSFYMGGELVGKIRYKKSFLENVPIPIPDNNQEEKISTLVDQIIYLKNENLDADTSELENKIDQLVFQLYELTEEEIKIVEESVK
jgi:type II restriction/modification system DNA methylase subunit YeeA